MGRRPASSNRLRIIGGSLGGRRIRFPDAPGLRPTSDRARETLFNWLAPDIAGSRCLDLFAGSGALGFEALSRGAVHVTMIDSVARVTRQLRENADELGLQDRLDVITARAGPWLESRTVELDYDIVFLDPPFADQRLQSTVDQLFQALNPNRDCLVYVERSRQQSLPVFPGNCQPVRDKSAGDVAYSLFQYSQRG